MSVREHLEAVKQSGEPSCEEMGYADYFEEIHRELCNAASYID
jgi:hypothetical protein